MAATGKKKQYPEVILKVQRINCCPFSYLVGETLLQ